jgi:hypothetical protein
VGALQQRCSPISTAKGADRRKEATSVEPIDQNDIVARNGLAHGAASDRISRDAKVEIERPKAMRGAARH